MRDTQSPRIGPPKVVYENKHFQVRRVEANFGKFTKEYFVVDTGTRAGMVVAAKGSLLLVQQYRLLIDGLSWEIPGGRVDDGETPVAAAVRECLEETGVQCLNPRPLTFYHAGLDVNLNPTHLFFCEEVSQDYNPPDFDGREVCGCEWVPLTRCIEMISQGQIKDSFSILAILAYHTLRSGHQGQI